MGSYVAHGLNETNVSYIRDTTGAVSNGADFTTTVPAHMRGKGWVPLAASVAEPGAGAVGARTLTHRAVAIKSYVETTGVITLTAGAAIAAGALLSVSLLTAAT